LNKESSQLESFLGLHDFSHDTFSHCFFPRQLVDGLDHLGIGFPLVLQILGLGIINVVLFGNPVKTIDPGVSSLNVSSTWFQVPCIDTQANETRFQSFPTTFECRGL